MLYKICKCDIVPGCWRACCRATRKPAKSPQWQRLTNNSTENPNNQCHPLQPWCTSTTMSQAFDGQNYKHDYFIFNFFGLGQCHRQSHGLVWRLATFLVSKLCVRLALEQASETSYYGQSLRKVPTLRMRANASSVAWRCCSKFASQFAALAKRQIIYWQFVSSTATASHCCQIAANDLLFLLFIFYAKLL